MVCECAFGLRPSRGSCLEGSWEKVREFLSVELEMRDDRGVYIRDVASAPSMDT